MAGSPATLTSWLSPPNIWLWIFIKNNPLGYKVEIIQFKKWLSNYKNSPNLFNQTISYNKKRMNILKLSDQKRNDQQKEYFTYIKGKAKNGSVMASLAVNSSGRYHRYTIKHVNR